ncbi:LysR substrate-binding domain-containing protein [Saccharopolyspora hattusasensis]|uniref:LysR substrate-binding domain-containing protein n=1 Tax=Saccharopolyspora hattusasensis TaxID=1128679 RepID=UPI003D988191
MRDDLDAACLRLAGFDFWWRAGLISCDGRPGHRAARSRPRRHAVPGRERVAPEVHDGEAVQMLPALCNGELDVVVLESWTHCPTPIPKGVQVKRVLHEHALLAVPADHPHANLRSANLADLQDQLWATCPPDTDTYEALVQLLRTNDHHEIDVRYYVADGATQLRLVAAGLAVALIPEMVATPTPPGVTLLPCEPAATRNILAATKKADETPQARAFTRELRETARAT